ncbi:MAG: VOC family protein [Chromatiales bacterium]|nr:VOC family protein [Chromatiales bacterium]
MNIIPYLFFNGRCEEAIEFYRRAVDAEVTELMRYKDGPDSEITPPGADEKIMHACITVGDSMVMMSDGDCDGKLNFAGVSLAIGVDDLDEGGKLFNALADGGQVQMPFSKTFWSPGFGMLLDRFGVSWMVNVNE